MATTELQAGRELDASIARRVMGAQWQRTEANNRSLLKLNGEVLAIVYDDAPEELMMGSDGLPGYSTDIRAAWQVVEHINRHREAVDWTVWTKAFGYDLGRLEMMRAPEVAEYICRAALAAVEGLAEDLLEEERAELMLEELRAENERLRAICERLVRNSRDLIRIVERDATPMASTLPHPPYNGWSPVVLDPRCIYCQSTTGRGCTGACEP